MQHYNKKCIWHFPVYLPFYWIPHYSEWQLQIPGDNWTHSVFKNGILMCLIRNSHLSSDTVVSILVFSLFCGNLVRTQACGINWWKSVLSEASPRYLNNPLRRVVWDKFIRNICLQQRKWCTLFVFCRLGWEHSQGQMMERFGLQRRSDSFIRFAWNFISVKSVYCELVPLYGHGYKDERSERLSCV